MIIGQFRVVSWDSCNITVFQESVHFIQIFKDIYLQYLVTYSWYLFIVYSICDDICISFSESGYLCFIFFSLWSISTKLCWSIWFFQILALLLVLWILYCFFPTYFCSYTYHYLSLDFDLICCNFSLILSLMHLRL